MRRWLCVCSVVTLGLAAEGTAASPFDGKWTAHVIRSAAAGNQDLAMMFKTDEASRVTGTLTIVGPGGGDFPLDWGMIKGDLITFKVKVPGGQNNREMRTFVYLGKIEGDHVAFGRRPEDLTQGRLVEFTADRVK